MGSGYNITVYYQYLFLQCMFILQYRGQLNSQTVHGHGMVGGDGITGHTDKKGMMYGSSSKSENIKIFGIEDLWANNDWFLDGYYVNNNYEILTATDNFNETGSGYKNNGKSMTTKYTSEYFDDVTGNPETGFSPLSTKGSSTTYFCDYASLNTDSCMVVGGDWMSGDFGIFRCIVSSNYRTTGMQMGVRLSYF